MEKKIFVFFEEGKEKEPKFFIQATNYDEAYELAYDQYGPQVEDLFYSAMPLQSELSSLKEAVDRLKSQIQELRNS